MAEHDFRYTLLNPAHTLTECRALAPGRYQVTGNGGSIRSGDVLIVTSRAAAIFRSASPSRKCAI